MKYTKDLEQEFMSIELIEKAKAAGAKFEDCTYYWLVDGFTNKPIELCYGKPEIVHNYTHYQGTYSMSELLYKLPEWTYKEDVCYGALTFLKDAPFYIWCFYPKYHNQSQEFKDKYTEEQAKEILKPIEIVNEYPIISAAYLWIYCLKNNMCSDWSIKDKRYEKI